MNVSRRLVISVVGSAGQLPPELKKTCHQLGEKIIDAGFRLVTGGLSGVMAAVSEGGRTSENWKEGSIIGILPGYDRNTANPWVDFIVPTGMQYARNTLVAACADVVIGVHGRSGTLSELALAWQMNKPVIVLAKTGGWAEKVAGMHLDDRRENPVIGVYSVEEAIQEALKSTKQDSKEPQEIKNG